LAKRPQLHPAALGQIRVDFNLHRLFRPVKLRIDYTFNGHSASRVKSVLADYSRASPSWTAS
jgi:hypothetical protein